MSPAEVAAGAGHKTTATATSHYAKRRSGWGADINRVAGPSAEDVEKVIRSPKSTRKENLEHIAKKKAEREAQATAAREAQAEAERGAEPQATADRKAPAKAAREAQAKAEREAQTKAEREAQTKAEHDAQDEPPNPFFKM